MWTNPELLLDLAHDRRRQLIAEADQARLLASARTARRARKAAAVSPRPAGRLAACEPSAAVPAR
jgi:hypothetical protein